tara:strand:- start:1828 stop:2502 length:675 start_codon:yes stop_codon:yes gene_type:complete
MNSVLQGIDLSKHFEGAFSSVLNKVCFSISAGEKVGLLGPSGTGKSTLLHILSGVEVPDKGWVELDGQNLSRLSPEKLLDLRKFATGTIFQFFHLLPTLSAYENAEMSLLLNGVSEKNRRSRVEPLFERLEIKNRMFANPSEMSGGELQRVAIIRAIAHKPKVIFADEPTGNLDQETGDLVLNCLSELCSEENIALVMVTHSRQAASICDRVMRLEHGELKITI